MKRVFCLVNCLVLIMPSLVFASSNMENDEGYSMIILKVVLYVLIFIIVILFAFYGTKFMAKRSSSLFKSKHTQIIDSINLGLNNKIILAKISNYIYIIAINNNQTTLIDKIEANKFFSGEADKSFDKYLNQYINNNNDLNTNKNIINIKNKVKEFFKKSNTMNVNSSKEEEQNEKDN